MTTVFARRILVPTDFSAPSDRALDVAIELARHFQSDVALVHVLLPPSHWGLDGTMLEFPELADALRKELLAPLAERAARVRAAGLACTDEIIEGRAHQVIVAEAARRGVDLIVVGTHGRTGIGHAFLGSVAERVVQHARCPVLVVPSPDPEAASPTTGGAPKSR